MVIDEAGLAFRDGPLLARMVNGDLTLAEDRERVTALLSIAYRQPVSEASIEHIDAAAGCWRRGDKALANLRLVFAGLPRLEDTGDLARLRAAEWLLDQGLAPRVLMKELGLDPVAPDLAKYDPDQPRVPAGHGRESGRWSDDAYQITDTMNSTVPASGQFTSDDHRPNIISVATTKKFGHACKTLGIDPIEASEALHAAKQAAGLGAADDCTFDTETGDIFYNDEHIGNLGD